MKKYNLYFFLIILLAFILRFFQLGINPPSLYWDEVSLGYNAYSILTTGRDEFGIFLPLDKFIAFGDFKPVGYVYTAVPAIFIFGLNEFAVRFPSALAGILMVVFTFYLVKKLFTNQILAFIASFLLAISPWSLHLSRVAFEANLAALFNLLGVYLFVKGIKDKGWWLILSMLFLSLAFYTFNSNRVITPIMVLGLIIIFSQDLWLKKKWFVASLVSLIIFLAPLIPYLKSRESRLRFHEVNIFSDLNVVIESNQQIFEDGNSRLAKIAHHRYWGHLSNFLKHYFDHFNNEFLFISGDVNPRLSVRSVGELYLIELPFFLTGIYLLLVNIRKKPYLLILFWFLIAPIPAAVARETPHALRIVSILPTPQIISGLGFYYFWNFIKKKRIYLFDYLLIFLLGINFTYYLYSYYFIFPKKYADQWLDGYKQAVEYIKENENKYDRIYITNYYSRPYIYLLFYLQYPPEKYNSIVNRERDWFGNWTVKSFDNYFFEELGDAQRTLYLLKPGSFIDKAYKIGEINNSFNQPVFWIFEKL